MSCPRCHMYVATHPLHEDDQHRLYAVEGPLPHACPEPWSYERALSFAQSAAAYGGVVVSQRVKAAIRLGIERGPEA